MRRINIKLTSMVTLICFFISGCTAMTTISSKQSNVSLRIENQTFSSLPAKNEFPVTTFGPYVYLAEKEGYDPLYGILPLSVDIGSVILDSLLFAPALFFNVRYVFPYYEIDIDKKLIRFSHDGRQWWESNVSPEETEQAKAYFKEASKREAQKNPKSTGFAGIELINGNIIEGQIISMNADTIIIRTTDGKESSYSFIKDVYRFIQKYD